VGNRSVSNSTTGATGGLGGTTGGGGLTGGRGSAVGGLGGLGGQSFGRNSFGGQNGFGQTGFGQNGFNSNTATQRVVRPQQRIAFEFQARPRAQVQSEISTRFTQLSGGQYAGVTVGLDEEGQARLSGTVPTEDARRLAEIMAGFEPGVRSVTNELSVAGERSN
jgi:osmotically-inducible protein OsmY